MGTQELIATSVGIFSLLLVAIQVHIAAKTLRDDHSRRRSQATLDYIIHDLRPHWGESLRDLTSAFNNMVPMPPETLMAIQADTELRRATKRLLASIEHMALGVNIGVFDLAVLDRSSGIFLIRIYKQFLPYIRQAQIALPTAYVEFDAMVNTLCLRRGRPLPDNSDCNVPQSAGA
jgi:hypothetical protein